MRISDWSSDVCSSDLLYVHYDAPAVAHLFSVAAGLDSAVLGESEVLGQVKTAWEHARAEGAAGPALNLLFRHALEAGKRARSDSAIGRHTPSVPSAAASMAGDHLGDWKGVVSGKSGTVRVNNEARRIIIKNKYNQTNIPNK